MFLSLRALPTASSAAPANITLTKSGLLKQDPLTQRPDGYWKPGGDAQIFNYVGNSSGLFVGAQTSKTSVYAGYYECACKQSSAGQLFHANITMYYTSSSYDFNTGLYIQDGSGLINYIFCGADANASGYYWDVVEAFGNSNSATQFNVLYSSKGGPLIRECTIITNGSNYLKVYIDNELVFSSTKMNQQMAAPFQAYLEVETAVAGQMWWGKYLNYYATRGEYVKVTHVPASSTVVIMTTDNVTLVSAQSKAGCGNSCTVRLEVANFNFPLTSKIEVIHSGNVTASSGLTTIWAGGIYSVV